MKEYILCAAIHYDDGIEHVHQPKNISTGYVIAGRRHHNCIATIAVLRHHKSIKAEKEQGFITNTNRFVDRKEGMSIAFNANQILDHAKTHRTDLFSEDLY